MTGPNCADLLKSAEDHARRVMIGGKGQLCPLAHLVRADGEEAVIGTPWKDEFEREVTYRALRALLHDGSVIRYMLLSEAWASKAPPGWKLGDPDPDPLPADSPDRVEIVMACAVERGGRTVRSWETKRDAAGNCVELVEQADTSEWRGRWLGLFEDA
ncbi:MAG TPA: hypothetical protein VHT52_04175 [Stellaceae bacterium]|jgi:hypothetical protein|nr:hypothetical protein [Stellaceae bacterium]